MKQKSMTVEMTFQVKMECGFCEMGEWDDEEKIHCTKHKCEMAPNQWCVDFQLAKGLVKDTFWIKK